MRQERSESSICQGLGSERVGKGKRRLKATATAPSPPFFLLHFCNECSDHLKAKAKEISAACVQAKSIQEPGWPAALIRIRGVESILPHLYPSLRIWALCPTASMLNEDTRQLGRPEIVKAVCCRLDSAS